MAVTTMKAKDSISGKMATCYVTINKNKYVFANAISLEAEMKKKKVEVPILGQTGMGNKSVGWSGTGKATMHYNTSVFRKLLSDFKDKGEDLYFSIQITNSDPSSSVGKQTVILKNCNLDGGIIAKFDAGTDILDEEVSFTFDDFEIKDKFKNLKKK